MARRRYTRRSRSGYSRNKGAEAARRHIQEAESFSREMGGTDEDVKRYFFSLPQDQLDAILSEYGSLYGQPALNYARETFSDWRSGNRHMSGLVSKRLFDLLPRRMPLKKKYALVESLWKFKCPRSAKRFYIGPKVNLAEIEQVVESHLMHEVQNYLIPDEIVNRFKWLAGGDVNLQQQLYNHFMQLEKNIILDGTRNRLPILINQLQKAGTSSIDQTIAVGNHEVHLHFKPNYKGITDVAPVSAGKFFENYGCLLIFAGVVLFFMLRGCSG